MMKSSIFTVAAALALWGCNGTSQNQEAVETPAAQELTLSWKTDTVCTGSESALYDPAADVVYVSNGNTKSGEKDNDGFISILNTDGTVRDLKWVEGGLDAPKGMALLNGKIYVTDIDAI